MSNTTINYKASNGVTVDIRRPTGIVETVDVSATYHRLNDVAFARIKAATKEAGKGDCLSYTNHQADAVYALSDADMVDVSHDQVAAAGRMGD